MIWITEIIISLSEYRFSSGLLYLFYILFVSTVAYGEGSRREIPKSHGWRVNNFVRS